jgi:hypothetical protein
MFRTKLTLAGLALAAAVAAPVAQADPARNMHDYLKGQSRTAGHDPWYGYALSLTQAQQRAPFITDTLAPGGMAPAQSVPFITDTLAPGGSAPAQSYRFITDTLAPGGGSGVFASPASNGFDWADAGIGAGAMAGVALLLLCSSRLVQQRRKVVAV